SDWLLAPPIPGLGLSLQNDNFRTALKFRLGLPLFDTGLTCSATSSRTGDVCGEDLDVFGDHALCCHFGTSGLFRHNNLRSRSHGSWALGGRDREEASTRRGEEEARRHHGTAVPPRVLVVGLRRHGGSPVAEKT